MGSEMCIRDRMYDYAEEGVERDIYKAIEWYTAAAHQNEENAQYNLAVIYDEGEGVAAEDQKAVYWYQRAAQLGEDNAQTNLGVMYFNGEGIDEDIVESLAWTYLGAEAENEFAIKNIPEFENDASARQIRRAKRRADELRSAMRK